MDMGSVLVTVAGRRRHQTVIQLALPLGSKSGPVSGSIRCGLALIWRVCDVVRSTSPAGSTTISACACQAASFGTTPKMHFSLTGALTDTIAGQAITHDSTKEANAFETDPSRGQVLDLTSSESGKFVLNSAVASGILDGSVWTMSVWFKPVAQSQRVPILVRYDKDYTPRGGFEIHYETNKNIIFMRYDGANVYKITSATTANEWTHLAFVSSEKAISLYIDGH